MPPLRSTAPPPPRSGGSVTDLLTRPGTPGDVDEVVAMHARCTPASLESRFHAAIPRVSVRTARELLTPPSGWSLVAELDDRIVGLACAGPLSRGEAEVGLLIEDEHQGRGIGSRMLHEVAVEAIRRGYRRLVCWTQPDNDRVPATVAGAGLAARLTRQDGLLHVAMPLAGLAADLPRPA